MTIDDLKFDANGLIPAVVQDYFSKRVLTVAYMNREALEISMREGRTCFFSRSRQQLWRKGETSGNVQQIVTIKADCDLDALTVEVIKAGPACHTGAESCFFNLLYQSDQHQDFSLEALYQLLQGRKTDPKEGSYTTYLFQIVAGKGGDREETIFEIADLAYHVLVLMVEMGIAPKDIFAQMESRHVVDHKVKQEKMK